MKRIAVFLALLVLASPVLASAQTTTLSREAQIAALQAQVAQLTQLLATLLAQQGASGDSLRLSRNLYLGVRGTDVSSLQRFLRGTGDFTYPEITGYYGTVTEQAVRRYQCREMNLCSGSAESNGYGVVGPKTRASLREARTTANGNTETTMPQTSTAPPTRVATLPPTSGGGGGGTTSGGGGSGAAPNTTPAPTCTPLPQETRTLSCPTGQTGSITETRTSTCATGAASPAWEEWQVVSNDCRVPPPPPGASTPGSYPFQVSSWIDLGLRSSVRGFWTPHTSYPADQLPLSEEIRNAKNVLRTTYRTNQLYLIYYRQFEIEQAKTAFITWRDAPGVQKIIPTLALQTEAGACNFSNDEVKDLVSWLKQNVNDKAIAVYEARNTATDSTRDYCGQLNLVKQTLGGTLIRIGLQPGEPLTPFDMAVGDTYSAVSSGSTNELWQTACGFTRPTAQEELEAWVDERVGSSKVAWNFVVVGFNYESNAPCGSDTMDAGDDPLPAGRNWPLVHNTIVGRYPDGGQSPNWAGFSFDGKIIQVASEYRDDPSEQFYQALKEGRRYTGVFSQPLDEIGSIFDKYDDLVL